MVALLALWFGADGGAWSCGRATYLTTSEDGSKAIYLAVYEPNGEMAYKFEEHKQKTWCNQCMWKTSRKGDLKGKEGGNGTPTTMS